MKFNKLYEQEFRKNSLGQYEDEVRAAIKKLNNLPEWFKREELGKCFSGTYSEETDKSELAHNVITAIKSNISKLIDLSGLFDSWEVEGFSDTLRSFRIIVTGIKTNYLKSLREPIIASLSDILKVDKVVIHRDTEYDHRYTSWGGGKHPTNNDEDGFINVYVTEFNKKLLDGGIHYDFKWQPPTNPENYKVYDFIMAFNTGDYAWDNYANIYNYTGSFDELFEKYGKKFEQQEDISTETIRKELESTGAFDGDDLMIGCKQLNQKMYDEIEHLYY